MAEGGRGKPPTRMIVAGVLALLVVILIAQNTAETRVDILFVNVTWPLWLLLSVVALLSFVAGWFVGRRR
jgi:uncharacterized integral membrane protein